MQQIQQLIAASNKAGGGDVNGVFEITLKYVVTGAFSREELLSLDEEGLRKILSGLTAELTTQTEIEDAIEIGELIEIRDNVTDNTITVEAEDAEEQGKPKDSTFADRLAAYLGGVNECPFCGSEDLYYGDGDFGAEAGQEASCNTCEARWVDAYKMTHIVVSDISTSGVEQSEVEEAMPLWFAVTGRIPFDDEDTTHIFYVGNQGEAVRLFEEAMYEGEPEGRREQVIKENGRAVFLTNILASADEIQEVGRPI